MLVTLVNLPVYSHVRIFLHLLIAIVFGFFTQLSAQSCCSGGVPTSSNLGLVPNESGQLVLSLGADLNFLNTLKSGTQRLDDDLRNRSTQSYLIRAAYTPLEKLNVEVLLPYVVQTRRIITNNGDNDRQRTSGVGDITLLTSYKILDKRVSMSSGIGVSIPTGDFDQRDNRGLYLLEDLQAGSGALDIIIYNYLGYNISPSNPNQLLSLRTIYAKSGTNDRSRNGNQTYQFGNDLQVIFDYSDQVLLGTQLVSPYAGIRYRGVTRDRVDDIPNSGSGGQFVFLRGGFNWNVTANSSFFLGGESAIHSSVNETQLAPSYSLNFGWTTSISKMKEEFESIIN